MPVPHQQSPVLILASESPRRKELLRRTGADFLCVPADVAEYSEGDIPDELPAKNALLKAEFVAERFPEHFVLGADTGVFSGQKMLGKPADHEDAVRMLSALSGTTHRVITGTALVCRSRQIKVVWSTVSYVSMGVLSREDIENYLRCVYVLDKAGAYAIQEHPELLKASWQGELENIIGLPLLKLNEVLKSYQIVKNQA